MRKIKMANKNPFIVTGYLKPKYYCDRNEESELLINKVENNEPIMLISHNGIGKTSLIKNVFFKLRKKGRTNQLHIDLANTSNLGQFIINFYTILFQSYNNKSKKKVEELKFIISNESGEDHLTSLAKLEEEQLIIKFNQLLELISSKKRRTIIAFDNYHNAAQYPLKKFEEKILIPCISRANIGIILSGTKKLFSLPNDNIIYLDKISQFVYQKFISEMFNNSGRSITKKNIDNILDWTKCDLSATQIICSRLWLTKKKNLNDGIIVNVINETLREYGIIYCHVKNLLSPYQWKLLKAIASEGTAIQITSTNFISRYELNAPSSVKTALTSLIEKELIYRERNSYQISDVIFGHWAAIN